MPIASLSKIAAGSSPESLLPRNPSKSELSRDEERHAF
jgi:hypothetical protein